MKTLLLALLALSVLLMGCTQGNGPATNQNPGPANGFRNGTRGNFTRELNSTTCERIGSIISTSADCPAGSFKSGPLTDQPDSACCLMPRQGNFTRGNRTRDFPSPTASP